MFCVILQWAATASLKLATVKVHRAGLKNVINLEEKRKILTKKKNGLVNSHTHPKYGQA